MTKIQLRRDTAAAWTAANPVLSAGEPGFETDTGKQKIGDGTAAWTALPYQGGGTSASTLTSGTLAPARIADASLPLAKLAATLATVATTGAYADLTGQPTIPAATTDAGALTTGTLPAARIADGSVTAVKVAADVATQAELDAHAANAANPHAVTKAQVGLGNVDNTADSVKPVSTAQAAADALALARASNLSDVASASTSRTNLGLGTAAVTNTGTGPSNTILGNDSRLTDSRTPTTHTHPAADLSDSTATGRALVTASSTSAARTTLGLVIGTDVEAQDADLTTIAGLAPADDDVLMRKAGAWANRTLAQLKTDLGLVLGPMTPAADQWLNPTFSTGYTTGTPSSGVLYIAAVDVGPSPLTVKGLGINVVTASVAGPATITVTLGLYKGDTTGGFPNFTQLSGSAVVDTSSTGIKYGAFGSPVALTPGRYWAGCLYYAVGTPTTAPILTTINTAINVPFPAATAPGSAAKAHIVTGLTALPSTSQTVTSTGGSAAAAVAIRAN